MLRESLEGKIEQIGQAVSEEEWVTVVGRAKPHNVNRVYVFVHEMWERDLCLIMFVCVMGALNAIVDRLLSKPSRTASRS